MKTYDKITYFLTYLASSITVFTLGAILIFTFFNGIGLLNFDLLTNNYNSTTYSLELKDDIKFFNEEYSSKLNENEYYSAKWGIGLSDSTDTEGKSCIIITIIHSDCPIASATDNLGNPVSLEINSQISSFLFTDAGYSLTTQGAESMVNLLEISSEINTFAYQTAGGGIRGSLQTTLYLIVLTIIIVVPFGILSSIYINEYAKKNKVLSILQGMIDMLSGVPSIIFGLMGAAVFIPLVNKITNTEGSSGSIIAGALTMSVILLPVIIKTTVEGLKTVPNDLRQASLALGANETQTTFKVVLPNAIGSITTGVILAIGRIVGESAALIFVMGTYISDNVSLSSPSTSLAVHIWSVMAKEVPNFELASSIALIILVFVLGINLSVKFLSKKLNKFII